MQMEENYNLLQYIKISILLRKFCTSSNWSKTCFNLFFGHFGVTLELIKKKTALCSNKFSAYFPDNGRYLGKYSWYRKNRNMYIVLYSFTWLLNLYFYNFCFWIFGGYPTHHWKLIGEFSGKTSWNKKRVHFEPKNWNIPRVFKFVWLLERAGGKHVHHNFNC